MVGEIVGLGVTGSMVGFETTQCVKNFKNGNKKAAAINAAGATASAGIALALRKHPLLSIASVIATAGAAELQSRAQANGTTFKEEVAVNLRGKLDGFLAKCEEARHKKVVKTIIREADSCEAQPPSAPLKPGRRAATN